MESRMVSSRMSEEETREFMDFGRPEYCDIFYYDIIRDDENWNWQDEFNN